jgi:prevent-host-death family protein
MRRIAAVAELKAQLSCFLRCVRAGDAVLVTEHGVPVARIVPIDPVSETVEGVLDLERQGIVRLGSGLLPDGLFQLRRGSDPKARVYVIASARPLHNRGSSSCPVEALRSDRSRSYDPLHAANRWIRAAWLAQHGSSRAALDLADLDQRRGLEDLVERAEAARLDRFRDEPSERSR